MIERPLRYAISDRNAARELGCATPVDQARLLAAEGIEFYQLREKDLGAAELAELAGQVLRALAGTGTRLLINSRVDVAVAIGADGVHLTSSRDELTPTQVRRVYAAAGNGEPLVTVSCHTLDDVARIRREPLTAILFGPVFGKTIGGTRVAEATGTGLLREACALASPIPVLALGGVSKENSVACLNAGAAGIAGIRLFQRFPRGQ